MAAARRVDRRLAAILAADVAGYSRLMGRDEAGTLERLKDHRKALVEPLVAEHRGRIVKLMGDGALCEFGSAVDAVQCAVEVQRGMAERERGALEDERIAFRIGINLGDIIHEEDGDIYGDGVNVAARVEQLAEPGGVCLSRTVHDHVRGKLDLAFASMGRHQVKNIAEPVEVWRVVLDGAASTPRRRLGQAAARLGRRPAPITVAAALALLVVGGGWYGLVATGSAPAGGATPQGGQPTLVVLPFANMSGEPSLDYFSHGIAEELTAQLARNPELRVVARSTAFAYKGEAVDMRRLGREVGARYALESSVRKAGDRVRVVAQLIDTATGTHVWADRYDEEGGDVLALQDPVVQRILASLGGFRGQIRQAGYREVWAKPAAALEEYDYFLRIHGLIVSGEPEALDEARLLALEGLERYPDSGFLKIKLGWTHMQRADRGLSAGAERDADLARAYALGREGLAHRDLTALARMHGHWLMALAELYHKRDFAGALAEREAALAFGPLVANVNGDLARVADFAGRPDLVVASLPGLLGEAPPDARPWLTAELSWAHCLDGQPALGIERLEGLREPSTFALEALAYCYMEAGRREAARLAARDLLAKDPSFTLAAARARNPFKDGAVLDRYLADLRQAGVPEG